MVVLEEGKLIPNRYICLQKSMQTLHYSDPEGRTCDPEWLQLHAKVNTNAAC
jgi:hypothetical protein